MGLIHAINPSSEELYGIIEESSPAEIDFAVAKKWAMQKKELLAKVIAYNIHRLVQLLRM